MKRKKSFLIVGLGAIGSVIYSRLERKGYHAVCLTSEGGYQLVRKKGLVVEIIGDESPHLHTCDIYHELSDDQKFDSVIITTKSWLNRSLVNTLAPQLDDSASILFFQNGINIEKPFLDKQQNWKITRAITTLAALRESKNHVIEANKGETKLGGLNYADLSETNFWKELLLKIGLPAIVSDNIKKDIWLKIIINSSINPLGAITGLTNGAIIQDSSLNFLVRNIIEEILLLAPKELMINFYEAYSLIEKITLQSSNHKCSMLQDIEAGIKTEIDTLNGEMVEIAKAKNVEVPVNTVLVEIVKKLSEENYPKELAILDLKAIM